MVGERERGRLRGVVEQEEEAVAVVDLAAAVAGEKIARAAVVLGEHARRARVAQPLDDGSAVDEVGEEQGVREHAIASPASGSRRQYVAIRDGATRSAAPRGALHRLSVDAPVDARCDQHRVRAAERERTRHRRGGSPGAALAAPVDQIEREGRVDGIRVRGRRKPPRQRARAAAASISIAPPAPSRWPWIAFVEVTGTPCAPNTRRSIRPPAQTPASVAVPWSVEMADRRRRRSPASTSAARIARACPAASGFGDVHAVAVSSHSRRTAMPAPRRRAPCVLAASRGRTRPRLRRATEAGAVGGERPARTLLRGLPRDRRRAVARARASPAHLATTPGVRSDSLPPAMAMSIQPARIARIASPIATADDAHAHA